MPANKPSVSNHKLSIRRFPPYPSQRCSSLTGTHRAAAGLICALAAAIGSMAGYLHVQHNRCLWLCGCVFRHAAVWHWVGLLRLNLCIFVHLWLYKCVCVCVCGQPSLHISRHLDNWSFAIIKKLKKKKRESNCAIIEHFLNAPVFLIRLSKLFFICARSCQLSWWLYGGYYREGLCIIV